MGILTIVVLLIIPYLWGCLITGISKDKDADGVSVYTQGLLMFFLFFLGLTLAALKTDMVFKNFMLVSLLLMLIGAVLAIPFAISRVSNLKFVFNKPSKGNLYLIGCATLLGLISIIFTNQSYVNDATIETVRTTLDTGKLYVYSSLDGAYMLDGLPIYNKVLVPPMLYAVLSKITFTDIKVITGLIVPIFTYVLNMLLMWKVSEYAVSVKRRYMFMYAHMLLLICGTFLPKIAIPASAGFVLLRQGYTGYTWAYAVLAPFVTYLLCQKKYIRAFVMFIPIVGLLKLDSIYFAFKDFVNSYHSMGASGKLWILYLAAVFYFIYLYALEKKAFPGKLLLTGTGLIASAVCNLYDRLAVKENKHTRYCFLGWMILAALACVSYKPFADAKFSLSLDGSNKEIREVVDTLENWVESDAREEDGRLVVWACDDILEYLRICTTSVRPAYGRDFIQPLLTGYNYEVPESGQEYLVEAMKGISSDYKEYTEQETFEFFIENWMLEHTDIIVIGKDVKLTESIIIKLSDYEFNPYDIKVVGNYQYIHR